jgi:hypothetical protein
MIYPGMIFQDTIDTLASNRYELAARWSTTTL